MTPPKLQWLMTAEVDIGPRRSLGAWQSGERFIVDILGGRVEGDGFTARVMPGGADRQWLRPDGAKELQALYELELNDGTVLSVHNEGILDAGDQPAKQAPCRARITAPEGPWDWINRHMVVGDVTSQRPRADAVVVRFFLLIAN
jgi:hypothetical protein